MNNEHQVYNRYKPNNLTVSSIRHEVCCIHIKLHILVQMTWFLTGILFVQRLFIRIWSSTLTNDPTICILVEFGRFHGIL
jgi:hypothetical protein